MNPTQPLLWIHQVGELGTLDSPSSSTPWDSEGYPELPHPLGETRNPLSQLWGGKPSPFFPPPPTWRLECDPRRDPAARRERLCSSWVAALKGGDAAATTGTVGGTGGAGPGRLRRSEWGWGGSPENQNQNQSDSRSRQMEVAPSLQPLVSCFSPSPLSPLPPANFQPVGG